MSHSFEDCSKLFALLSEYLDDELPANECSELERHLADCPPCVAFLESLKKSIELCPDCGSPAGPAPISEAVRSKLRQAWRKALEARP